MQKWDPGRASLRAAGEQYCKATHKYRVAQHISDKAYPEQNEYTKQSLDKMIQTKTILSFFVLAFSFAGSGMAVGLENVLIDNCASVLSTAALGD